MTKEEMKRRKQELGYTNEMISELSGVPLSTVQKVFSGTTESPRYSTILALEKVLASASDTYRPVCSADILAQPSPVYSVTVKNTYKNDDASGEKYDRQGSYTLEDYLALPEDEWVELIDGVYYTMNAPTTIHQAIISNVYFQLENYILSKKGPCMAFISPLDVQLDCDNRTIVEPDILIVCDRDKLTHPRVVGAPDFVAEVLSPSTKAKDLFIKLNKYKDAGVREYWIIDPDKKSITVYDFEHEDFLSHYSFRDKVPVGIYEGDCEVDFNDIYEQIGFLYGPDQQV